MEKLEMHTPDITEENYQKLVALFPNAVTETVNEDGEVVRAIDADVLQQEISATVVEGKKERYQFTWPDKKKSVVLANQPIAKTLRLNREKSMGRDGTPGKIDTENIYIEGDNLDALKLLQETYLGKVKMIYIDPPYNTGSDAFVYDDDFAESAEEFAENSGAVDEDGNRLFDMRVNNESNGRFHTDWLNMMYPRLRLAKDLLADDGVIISSISDNEFKNLRAIMDEIYGAKNQVCCFVWKSRSKPTNAGNAKYRPQKVSEYVLVYSKQDPETMFFNVIPAKERTYPHEDAQGKYRTTTILTSNRGTFRRETMRFESHGYTPNEDFRWKAGKDIIDKLYDTNHMHINDDGTPMEKKYEAEESDPLYPIYTFMDVNLSGTAEQGKSELGGLIGKQHGFDTVKPVQLLKYFIQTFMDKNDILVDFFSGSATTAQACIEQNSEDYGKRKLILVQIPEAITDNSEAKKAGYDTICDIGEERIRRAGKKIKAETGKDIDYGFRVFTVDSSNMKDVYYSPQDLKQEQLSLYADNIKEDRTPEDLLFQVMLDLGVLLSSPIEEREIAGKKVFSVDGGYLIACFDTDVTEEVVTAIAKEKPFYAVFRDSSMANDSVMTNFEQIFETYSPNTVRKVL